MYAHIIFWKQTAAFVNNIEMKAICKYLRRSYLLC